MDLNPFDYNNPVDPSWGQIAERTSSSGFRYNFLENSDQSQKSPWFSLIAGEKYPIRALGIEYTGGDHLSVGMEFE